MQPKPSKQTGSLFTALVIVFTILGTLPLSVQAGFPASANFSLNSLSTLITIPTIVSVASDGTQGNSWSGSPSVSADGRYVAFYSAASNLVSEDTNGVWDIFLRDTLMSTTTRLSVDSNGMQGNFDSSSPSISTDGRFVAFRSLASNLVSGDTNGTWDIFLRDMLTHTTTRISVDSNRVEGNAASEFPAISANGRYVAFGSSASNLVSGDTNNMPDIFLRDTQTSTTKRISVNSSGTQGNSYSYSPSISADGRSVAFYSYASNLVSGDTNATWDVFVRDAQMDTTTRASVNSSGVEGNDASDFPSISADGRYVAFGSGASNLVNGDTNAIYDILLRDTQTNTTTRLSVDSSGTQGNDWSDFPSISADGRYVAFRSQASNLVGGDNNGTWDIFLRDTQTGTAARLSVNSSGGQGNDWSVSPSISADGRYVAFQSAASNLVSGDTNGTRDVFIVPAINTIFTNWIFLPLVIR